MKKPNTPNVKPKGKVVTKETLSRTIAAVLGLPYEGRQGEAYRILKTILHVMRDALLRSEHIKIDGLGIFKLHQRAARKQKVSYFLYFKQAHPPSEVIVIQPRKKAIFKPSKALTRFINKDFNG